VLCFGTSLKVQCPVRLPVPTGVVLSIPHYLLQKPCNCNPAILPSVP
jgi:hypothetical protein